jgi:Tfp pilus assembly protein PilN
MIEISLLPVEEEAKSKTAQKGLGFAIPKFIPRGFGVAVVVLLAMYALSRLQASSLSKTLVGKRQTLQNLEKAKREAEFIEGRLGPLSDVARATGKGTGSEEAPKDSGERLRRRAEIFRVHLEDRKVWSQILQEIILCCPEEIRLTAIKLSPMRTGTTTGQAKELVISGSYMAGANLEMVFKERLQESKTVGSQYQIPFARTEPQLDRTDFWIHCTEQ